LEEVEQPASSTETLRLSGVVARLPFVKSEDLSDDDVERLLPGGCWTDGSS
jgi:hypothetical protein